MFHGVRFLSFGTNVRDASPSALTGPEHQNHQVVVGKATEVVASGLVARVASPVSDAFFLFRLIPYRLS